MLLILMNDSVKDKLVNTIHWCSFVLTELALKY